MKKQKLYRYVGRNGGITSPILREDAKQIPLMELRPESGYVLTNGNVIREYFVVVHVDEVNEWTEVKADTVE